MSVGSCKSDLAVPSSTRRHDSAAHVCGASKAAQRTMLRICRLCPSQATGLQGRNPTAYGRVIAMGLCVLEGRAVQIRDRPKAGVTRPLSWTGRYCSTGRSVAPSFFFPFHSRNSVKLQEPTSQIASGGNTGSFSPERESAIAATSSNYNWSGPKSHPVHSFSPEFFFQLRELQTFLTSNMLFSMPREYTEHLFCDKVSRNHILNKTAPKHCFSYPCKSQINELRGHASLKDAQVHFG